MCVHTCMCVFLLIEVAEGLFFCVPATSIEGQGQAFLKIWGWKQIIWHSHVCQDTGHLGNTIATWSCLQIGWICPLLLSICSESTPMSLWTEMLWVREVGRRSLDARGPQLPSSPRTLIEKPLISFADEAPLGCTGSVPAGGWAILTWFSSAPAALREGDTH